MFLMTNTAFAKGYSEYYLKQLTAWPYELLCVEVISKDFINVFDNYIKIEDTIKYNNDPENLNNLIYMDVNFNLRVTAKIKFVIGGKTALDTMSFFCMDLDPTSNPLIFIVGNTYIVPLAKHRNYFIFSQLEKHSYLFMGPPYLNDFTLEDLMFLLQERKYKKSHYKYKYAW